MSVPTIVATVAGETSNSYVTLSEADGYFSIGLRADEWLSFSTELRTRALISATQTIDGLPVDEPKSSAAQALNYPREDDDDAIPVLIKKAVYEQAFWSLNKADDLVDHADLQSKGLTSLSMDGLSVSYSPGITTLFGLCPICVQLLGAIIPGTQATSTTLTPRFSEAYRDDFYDAAFESQKVHDEDDDE